MTDRREDRMRREAEGWERLGRAIGDLTDDELVRPGLSEDGWSIRDLLWHIAAWSEDAARVLREMGAGTWDGTDPSLEPGWTDRMNDEWFVRSRRMSPEDVRSAFPQGRAHMLEAFEALDAVSPDAEEWFDESGPLHYAEHIPVLEAWIERLRSPA